MASKTESTSLEPVLERIGESREQEHRVSVDSVLRTLGRRSFGPLLFFAGLIMLAPIIGDIPGVPVLMGAIVALTAVQLLMGRDHIWLPGWLLRRSVDKDKLDKTLDWLRPVARFLDRWSRPRLQKITKDKGVNVIAVACILIALGTPVMELVPFSANVAGVGVTAFGLALIVHDGLVALLALAFTAGAAGMLVYHWMGG